MNAGISTHRSADRSGERALRLAPSAPSSSAGRRRSPSLAAALLVLACPFASGTAAAETDAVGDRPIGARERVVDARESGRSEVPSPLLPRWITPRRLAADPVASAVQELAAPTTTALGTNGLTERSSNVRSVSVLSVDERSRDWRRAARIVIHGEAANERLATLTAELLTSLGAEEVERRRVGASSESDQIRYFDAADERMARDLADTLSPEFGRVPVMDFTAFTPAPGSGLLEMWLR